MHNADNASMRPVEVKYLPRSYSFKEVPDFELSAEDLPMMEEMEADRRDHLDGVIASVLGVPAPFPSEAAKLRIRRKLSAENASLLIDFMAANPPAFLRDLSPRYPFTASR